MISGHTPHLPSKRTTASLPFGSVRQRAERYLWRAARLSATSARAYRSVAAASRTAADSLATAAPYARTADERDTLLSAATWLVEQDGDATDAAIWREGVVEAAAEPDAAVRAPPRAARAAYHSARADAWRAVRTAVTMPLLRTAVRLVPVPAAEVILACRYAVLAAGGRKA